jgi:hypothetical protein
MRLLFAIPHYFDPEGQGSHGSLRGNPEPRIRALADCLATLRQQFGRPQCEIDIARKTTVPANYATAVHLDVVVCTTGADHLLDRLPIGPEYYIHQRTAALPRLLGFECHAVLRDRLGDCDYYCYLEDDLLIRDPLLFVKLKWFTDQFGDDALLQPNRYELARGKIVHKAYVDGPLAPAVTALFQNVADMPTLEGEALGRKVQFRRTLNPHSGCFFLNARQMESWVKKPYFLERDVRFVGPLESAASLGLMRAFRIYKPAVENGAFLEVEHPGAGFLNLIRMPTTGEATPPSST